MIGQVLGICVVCMFIWIWRSRRAVFKIPGPKGLPILGVSHQLLPAPHVSITAWNKEFGPVINIPLLNGPTVIVSSSDAIHEVTVRKGYAFGGRPHSYRGDIATERTGVLTSIDTDDKWKMLRKLTHRHLKQFGDGMSKLESVIEEVGQDMFSVFAQKCGEDFDPNKDVFDAALNSIAFLITGERTRSGDEIVEKMRHYEDRFIRTTAPLTKVKFMMIDFMPWLRFLGVEIWTMIQKFVKFEQEIWTDIKTLNSDNSTADSLCKILLDHIGSTSKESETVNLSEKDARRTSMNLLLAGVTTTSNTFYGSINILAHHQNIQTRMLNEIRSFCDEGEAVSLDFRPKMHYCRAFLLELLRYTSVVAMSVGHRAVTSETIQGYFIPKDTRVRVNIYGLHHDEKFWKDPDSFRPERFLDENQELVAADHPNRKHLMPFGAGPRVCVGETLAMTRLFMWITTFVNRFAVVPAKGNDPSTLDTKHFDFVGVLRPIPYRVVMTER